MASLRQHWNRLGSRLRRLHQRQKRISARGTDGRLSTRLPRIEYLEERALLSVSGIEDVHARLDAPTPLSSAWFQDVSPARSTAFASNDNSTSTTGAPEVFEVASSRIRQNSGRFAERPLPHFRPKSGDFGDFSSN